MGAFPPYVVPEGYSAVVVSFYNLQGSLFIFTGFIQMIGAALSMIAFALAIVALIMFVLLLIEVRKMQDELVLIRAAVRDLLKQRHENSV